MTAPAATQPAPQVAPFDTGNPCLAETPAMLTTTAVNGPGGQRLALTVRTASTTLTLMLTREDAQTWADQIHAAAGAMSGLLVPRPGAVSV